MKKIFATIVICVIFLLTGCGHEHTWEKANCIEPRTCNSCGETEGEALGHDWRDATCSLPQHCTRCGKTEGEPCPHGWIDASCVEPRKCFSCGITDGVPLGHIWEDATCTTAKVCSVCNQKEGNALGHSLSSVEQVKAPSCYEFGEECGICTQCGQTLSRTVPMVAHTTGDWVVTIEATFDIAGEKVKSCEVCGAVLEMGMYELTPKEKEQWFKHECVKISYNDVARRPNDYIGSRIYITGEVAIVVNEPDDPTEPSVYLVYTKKEHGFYFEEPYFVFVNNSDTGSRILVGDIITFYGEFDGLYDVWGEKQPKLNVVYYTVK